jgi:hypothetical protein
MSNSESMTRSTSANRLETSFMTKKSKIFCKRGKSTWPKALFSVRSKRKGMARNQKKPLAGTSLTPTLCTKPTRSALTNYRSSLKTRRLKDWIEESWWLKKLKNGLKRGISFLGNAFRMIVKTSLQLTRGTGCSIRSLNAIMQSSATKSRAT